jgi:hypothetical protein
MLPPGCSTRCKHNGDGRIILSTRAAPSKRVVVVAREEHTYADERRASLYELARHWDSFTNDEFMTRHSTIN